MATKKTQSVRLPSHTRPQRYRLELKPDFTSFTFEGQVTIFLSFDQPITEIILHARELQVLSADFIQKGQLIDIKKITHNPKNETVSLALKKSLQKGIGELSLKFTGNLNDNLRGFYRSKYLHNNREKNLATTQFESTDARAAFPSIDEPSAKAIFDVTLIIPKQMTAISNTIQTIVTSQGTTHKAVQFAPTPQMSTYLLAFIVGEFEYLEAKSPEGILVRVFTTPGKKQQAKFALITATKLISFYNDYFNIPYPLPVLDLIAIPDFAAGAMENWGAITFRETALLIDSKNSSAGNRQRVAEVIAHELAHMWFGDLVTMEWWTHLWLNEGFATYIEYLAVNQIFPQWDVWTQFIFNDHGRALQLDALANTHPIEIEVHHPDEISEIFDAVSYSKGASIIRMLADFLGDITFRDGLRFYLNKHQYANAKTEDLWIAFEHVSGQPVTKIMANWTSQPGYPLLTLKPSGQKLSISQSRFFSSPESKKQAKDRAIWSVPISMAGTKLKTSCLLSKKSAIISRPQSTGWVKLNSGEFGVYRTKYSPRLLEELKEAIESKKLPAADRLGIIRDVFDLSQAGEFKTDQALKLAQSYLNEDNFTVWTEIITHLSDINQLLAGTKLETSFKNYARPLFTKINQQLGWDKKPTDSHTDTMLRGSVFHQLGHYGDPAVIDHSQKLFTAFARKNKLIDPDLRGGVYNLVAENGGEAEYEILKQKYQASTLQQERDRLSRAMAQFKDPKLIAQTLEFALSKDVRNQDAVFVLASIIANPAARDQAWQFLKDNWETIHQHFSSGHLLLPRLIQSLAVFNTQKQIKDVDHFFKQHPTTQATRTIAQTLEKIRSNIAWLKRDHQSLAKFLKHE